ncbi:hypothetical protein [Nakamurella leprariae]|uniref:hypothetical protein n=1 Tax=Nakamurella leprariae TaxID=2803911 RepID=UPI00196281F7|nr:hypothetical protein [Nakamurella leprariae]
MGPAEQVGAGGGPGTVDLALADEVVVLRAAVARLRDEAAAGRAERERAHAAEQLAAVHAELSRVRELLAECHGRLRAQQPSGDDGLAAIELRQERQALELVIRARDEEIRAIRGSVTWRIGRLVIGPVSRVRRVLGRRGR